MKQELITEVMQQMLPCLDNAQLKQLRQVMEQALYHYEVTGTEVKPEEDDSNDLIAKFIAAKRIEGCSEKTLKYYQTTIDAMVSSLGKNVRHMGDAFIRGILQKLVENDTEGRYDVFGVLLMDFYSFTIYREWKNIDILLVSDEEKTVIAIENKVGSGEHSDQLNRYRKILEETYPDYQRVLAFLTPDGDAPSDEKNWGILTYLDIIDVLEDICSRMDLVPDVGLMIKNYVETLRRDVVDDQQLKEVCNKIYEKHKKALDLIFENRIDSKSQTAAAIRSVLLEYTENGKIIYDGSDNSDSYIKFYTKEMDELLKPMMENNSSWGNDRVYCFWMGSRDEAFRTVFELGGWNVPPELDAIQQKIIDIEKPNDKKRKDFRYKRVYSKKFTIDEADESLRSKMAAALDDMLMWQKRLIREITAEKE